MPSYATTDDLTTYGVSAAALGDVDVAIQQSALDAASAQLDGYFRSRFILPLVAPYPLDLIANVCAIAAWTCLVVRGFDPENPSDKALLANRDRAQKWMEAVADGKVDPGATDSQSGGTFEEQGGPFIQYPARTTGRGW